MTDAYDDNNVYLEWKKRNKKKNNVETSEQEKCMSHIHYEPFNQEIYINK